MCSLLLQCSTGYYQYNIDQNFKGSVKIFEKMGYVVEKQIGKPRYQVLEMKLGQINREVLASVLIELVFFGLELDVLIECVEFLQNPNIILEALEARKNAGGGVDVLIGYLMSKKRDKPMVPPYSPAQRKVNNQHQASSRGSGNSSVTSESYHTPQGSYRAPVASSDKSRNDSQGSNSPIPYVDPSNLNLPPPQPEPEPDPSSGNLDSMRHIDASSERDDGDTLIPDSTQLGYRNPPPLKLHLLTMVVMHRIMHLRPHQQLQKIQHVPKIFILAGDYLITIPVLSINPLTLEHLVEGNHNFLLLVLIKIQK